MDLYVDISSGADVTELINDIVSSGLIELDDLIESLNKKFGHLAEFTYQTMHQDGLDTVNLYINGYVNLSGQAGYDSKNMQRELGQGGLYAGGVFGGDTRFDSVKKLNVDNSFHISELESISDRWPAKIKLFGSALYAVLSAYELGNIYVIDNVKLSNGVTYSLEEAWSHCNVLHAKECAALGALLTYGNPITREKFDEVMEAFHKGRNSGQMRSQKFIHVVDSKDKLYKTNLTRYNEYRNNMINK